MGRARVQVPRNIAQTHAHALGLTAQVNAPVGEDQFFDGEF